MNEEIIYIKVPFKKIWKTNPDGSKTGNMSFRFEDCCAKVRGDEGEEIGEASGRIGGGYEFSLNENREFDLHATAQDLWNAYCDAIEKPDYKIL